MKSMTAQLKKNIKSQIEGLESYGVNFTGVYVGERHDYTEIAIMYERDGQENGDLWEIQGDELVIVEYGAFDTTPIENWPEEFELIDIDEF